MADFFTAVITAFDETGNPDKESNRRVYEHLIAGGSDGIVLLGSTGEFFSLTMDMATEIIDFCLETVDHRMKVIVGTSRLIPEETVALSNHALEKGADGVMMVSPFYFPLSDASIEKYYDDTIPKISGDVYLYNFPGCTGYDLKPSIALSLRRKYENVIGYKDTVPNFGHTRGLIELMHGEFPDFKVYSGYDEFFIHNITSGGAGCIGGLPNLAPDIFATWKQQVAQEQWQEAFETQQKVNKMMGFFEICNPFVTAIKHAMKCKGIIQYENSHSPLALPSKEEAEKVENLLERLNF